jgi:hypothetical protein
MMPGLTIRPATPADHAALEELFRATSMGSSIRLNIERDPDYFAGARVQAADPCVWAAFDGNGRAVGMLSAGKRRVRLGDGEIELRYLCDLRIHRDWQRSTLLARGFRLLKREIFAPREWAQTLVLEDNLQAIELLSSHRAGLPEYRPAGIYATWLLPTQLVESDPAVTVRRATRADLPEMQLLYDDSTRRRSFAPVLRGEKQDGREYVVTEYNENSSGNRSPMRSILTKEHAYLFNPWSNGERVMRTATQGTVTYRRMQALAKTDPTSPCKSGCESAYDLWMALKAVECDGVCDIEKAQRVIDYVNNNLKNCC